MKTPVIPGIEGATVVPFTIGCNIHNLVLIEPDGREGGLFCPYLGCKTHVPANLKPVVVGEAIASFLDAAGYEIKKVNRGRY